MQFGSVVRGATSIADLLQIGVDHAVNRSLGPEKVTIVVCEPSLLQGVDNLHVTLTVGTEPFEFIVSYDHSSGGNDFMECRWYNLRSNCNGDTSIEMRVVLLKDFVSKWGMELTIPPSYSMFKSKVYEMIYNDEEYDDDDNINIVWNVVPTIQSTIDVTLLLIIINALLQTQIISLRLLDSQIIGLHKTSATIHVPTPQLLGDTLDQFRAHAYTLSSELSNNFILRMVDYINKINISSRGISNSNHLFMKNVCSNKKRSLYLGSYDISSSGVKPLPECSTGLTVLEFFSGIGGMRLSLPSHVNGIPITNITAYDCNDIANQIYHHNFHINHVDRIPNSTLKRMMIDYLSVADVDGVADIWTMSPPCQPYTTTRNSKQLDEKDNRSLTHPSLTHSLNQSINQPTTYSDLFLDRMGYST